MYDDIFSCEAHVSSLEEKAGCLHPEMDSHRGSIKNYTSIPVSVKISLEAQFVMVFYQNTSALQTNDIPTNRSKN